MRIFYIYIKLFMPKDGSTKEGEKTKTTLAIIREIFSFFYFFYFSLCRKNLFYEEKIPRALINKSLLRSIGK